MRDALAGLNAAQREAVSITEGRVRVRAGPGTGKTRALTHRYAYLVGGLGISPRRVWCVTFTNKAALEMRERVIALCGDGINPCVSTFHGFCAAFLREEIAPLGFPPNFTILAVPDVKEMLRPLYAELGISGRQLPLKDAWEFIDAHKYQVDYLTPMTAPDARGILMGTDSLPPAERLFWHYVARERATFSLDFDDLIKFTLRILERCPEVRERAQARFEYIMVDEFQDIDREQRDLVEILAGRHHNLFVVGDPDQTIYSFRGADVAFFNHFADDFPGTADVTLTENYRSQAPILDCAFGLISNNPDPRRLPLSAKVAPLRADELTPTALPRARLKDADLAREARAAVGPGMGLLPDPAADPAPGPQSPVSALPSLARCLDHEDEVAVIAEQAQALREMHPKASIAVLYRSRQVGERVERAFIERGIPHHVVAEISLFERREVRDALAYLRLVVNPGDDLAFRRALGERRRGFGRRRLERLTALAARDGQSLFAALSGALDDPALRVTPDVREFVGLIAGLHGATRLAPAAELARVLEATGYEERLRQEGEQERLKSLKSLRDLALGFEGREGVDCTAADFLGSLSLFMHEQDRPREGEALLMTIHNAKGLEFDYVLLAGLEEKIFPSAKCATRAEVDEERRLMYVAMTRARRQLFMTAVTGEGEGDSRFVGELPQGGIMEVGEAPGAAQSPGAVPPTLPGLAKGERIFHAIMGPGTVLSVDVGAGECTVAFDSLPTPRTLSLGAPLERA
ncbi:MAG: ATP-dependent helicase [Succinivibrionaceae bacterium]|nr:ATP-dependent helicase [Succinivibrionaceae bacterium]